MNAVNVVAKNKRNKRATAQEHKVANAETEETTMGTEVLHGSRAGWVSTALKRAACFVGFTMMIIHGVLGSQRTLAAVDSVIALNLEIPISFSSAMNSQEVQQLVEGLSLTLGQQIETQLGQQATTVGRQIADALRV